MITPPPSVLSDLSDLVAEIRGKNTILPNDLIISTIESGNHPTVSIWLSKYEKSRNMALATALKQAGLEPFTRKRSTVVRTWKVVS